MKIAMDIIYQMHFCHSSLIFTIISGNLALRRPTKQSSTGYGGVSSRAVDGNSNTRYGGRSCTHTNLDNRPWWRVDLGASRTIKSVALTNRGDCCQGRLQKIDIKIGNVDSPTSNPL